jgi:hypothetical protein
MKLNDWQLILPADMWKYEILTYLDKDSRLKMNTLLDNDAKLIKKFTKQDMENHEFILQVTRMTVLFNRVMPDYEETFQSRLDAFDHIYSFILDNSIVLKNRKFRDVVKWKSKTTIESLVEMPELHDPYYSDQVQTVMEKMFIVKELCEETYHLHDASIPLICKNHITFTGSI